MAVLIEGISVVIRRDAIQANINGGWQSFQDLVSNQTLCTDGQLASVSFMSADDVERFTKSLKQVGLVFFEKGKPRDFCVVGMDVGPTATTPWLEFLCKSQARKISSCWLYEGLRDKGAGTYLQSLSLEVAVPDGWTYENSLTAHHIFVPPAGKTWVGGLMNGILTGVRRILKLGKQGRD